MRFLATFLLLAALSLAQQPKIPLANFSGTVHGVSKKKITIENEEGNLVDFEINKKTKVLRGKKTISPEDLKTGDPVAIEARQEIGQLDQYLIAVVITALPRPAP